MKSREPVLVRGRDYWDTVNTPLEAIASRTNALRDRMATDGVDAVLIYGRGEQDGHLCYITNLINKVPNWGTLCVLTPDTATLLFERSSRTRPVFERGTWIEDIRFSSDNIDAVADVFSTLDREVATIGVAGFGALTHDQSERFDDGYADYDVREYDDVLYTLRQHKSERERDQLRRASRVGVEVTSVLDEVVTGRTTERAIERTVERLTRLRGVQDSRFLIANPERTEPHLRPAEPLAVDPSDPINYYVAVRYEGYWSELVRTVRFDGESPDEDDAETIDTCHRSFVDMLEPGRTLDEVTSTLDRTLEAAGLTRHPAYDIVTGIGLEVDEPPRIDGLGADTPLEVGMALSVHLPVELPNGALFLTGDTVLIEDDGPAVVTRG